MDKCQFEFFIGPPHVVKAAVNSWLKANGDKIIFEDYRVVISSNTNEVLMVVRYHPRRWGSEQAPK